ncbi:hypothetical protein GW17_00024936 [Ensete ventricosum]|nr:hypothetical protein GW17_00024936 [Ensete ventricosum]
MNHKIAAPKTTNEDSSIAKAPHPMTFACFNMEGIAMLPTTDVPVKNFVKFTQLVSMASKKLVISDLGTQKSQSN